MARSILRARRRDRLAARHPHQLHQPGVLEESLPSYGPYFLGHEKRSPASESPMPM